MKKLYGFLLIAVIPAIFSTVFAAEFSDEFAKNLLTCTEYSENASSISGMDKGKCVMNAEYYTCRLSSSQAASISRAITTYNKRIKEEGFSYNAYKKQMMVFNKYINNPKVCTSNASTNFTLPKTK